MSLLLTAAHGADPPLLGESLVANPDFEAGAEGWGLPAQQWSLCDTVGHSGARSARIVNQDPEVYVLAGSPVAVTPGEVYAFSAWVRTEGVEGSDSGATVCLEWHDAAGAYLGGSYPQGLKGTNDWTRIQAVSSPMPAEATGATITVYLRKGCTGTAWFDDVEVHVSDAELSFQPVLRYPNYRGMLLPGQPRRAELLLPLRPNKRRPAESLGILVRVSDPAGKRLLEEEHAGIGQGPPTECTVDLSTLAPGDYSIGVRLFDVASGERLQTNSFPLTILAKDARLPRVVIDSAGRTLVDGEPVFPLGCYAADRRVDDLDHLQRAGFNCIMNYGMIGGSLDEMRGYLDEADRRGIRVLFSVKDCYEGTAWPQVEFGPWKGSLSVVRGMAETFRDHPAVLAWYINDELSGPEIPRIEERYDLLRAVDPDHPVWQVLWFGQDYPAHLASCDAIGVDNYPILAACAQGRPDSPAIETFGRASAALQAAVGGSRAIWMVPECSSQRYVTKDSRPPTLEELRCHAFQAITHGSRGLVFYWTPGIREDGEAQWQVLERLGAELNQLLPVLLADDAPEAETVRAEDARVSTVTRRVGDRLCVLAVNPYAESVTTVLRFGAGATAAEITVSDGERRLPVEGKAFADTLEPRGVRVYWVGAD